jgi:hypothetical protein
MVLQKVKIWVRMPPYIHMVAGVMGEGVKVGFYIMLAN